MLFSHYTVALMQTAGAVSTVCVDVCYESLGGGERWKRVSVLSQPLLDEHRRNKMANKPNSHKSKSQLLG